MEIILLKDIDKIGYKHEIVSVKNGYGRNYLIPNKLAVIANKYNINRLEKLKEEETASKAAMLEEYKTIAESLEGKTLKIAVKAGTSGKIFGSVTNIQLANALKDQYEVEIERRKIILPDDIKELGTYTAVLNLHPELESKIDFELVQD